jgi:hypothetical protein
MDDDSMRWICNVVDTWSLQMRGKENGMLRQDTHVRRTDFSHEARHCFHLSASTILRSHLHHVKPYTRLKCRTSEDDQLSIIAPATTV